MIRKRRINSCGWSVISLALWTVEPVILPFEGDALVVERDQTAVGDGNAVGIARKIAQHLPWSPERAFGVDNPIGVAQRRQIAREGPCIRQRGVFAEELELSGKVRRGELGKDQPPEQA